MLKSYVVVGSVVGVVVFGTGVDIVFSFRDLVDYVKRVGEKRPLRFSKAISASTASLSTEISGNC
jgi:hypothetical protein